jgi:tRNA pseudouridine38-40 synthase
MWAKLTIAYDGSRFFGSQPLRKKGALTRPTVLGRLNEALKAVGIDDHAVAAGRTDRGVHATAQVVSLQLPPHWQNRPDELPATLTRMLDPAIAIRRAAFFEHPFHARYDATSRLYRYLITPARPNPFEQAYMTHAPQFDFARAQEAIAHFKGTHDFIHFAKRGSGIQSTVRHIHDARIYRHRGLYVARFEANGFLRSQVRLMMTAILSVAARKAPPEAINDQLLGKGTRFRIPAPASGLYLAGVWY